MTGITTGKCQHMAPPVGLQMLSDTSIKKGVTPVYLAAVLFQGCTSGETAGFLRSMQQVDTVNEHIRQTNALLIQVARSLSQYLM